jgi:hypothetical protein
MLRPGSFRQLQPATFNGPTKFGRATFFFSRASLPGLRATVRTDYIDLASFPQRKVFVRLSGSHLAPGSLFMPSCLVRP